MTYVPAAWEGLLVHWRERGMSGDVGRSGSAKARVRGMLWARARSSGS